MGQLKRSGAQFSDVGHHAEMLLMRIVMLMMMMMMIQMCSSC